MTAELGDPALLAAIGAGDPDWAPAHRRWGLVLALLALLQTSRDPARRRLLRPRARAA